MAREKMITRTLSLTTVKFTSVTLSTSQVGLNQRELVGSYTKDTAITALKKEVETDDFKVVCVNDIARREALFGMSEADFYHNAKELPARNSTE